MIGSIGRNAASIGRIFLRNLGNPLWGTDVVPITRRNLIAVAVSGAATLVAPVAPGAEEEPFKFGLTPVFLSNDLELLGHLAAISLQDRRSGRARHSADLSGNHGAARFRANPFSAWICGYPYVQYKADLDLVATPSGTASRSTSPI